MGDWLNACLDTWGCTLYLVFVELLVAASIIMLAHLWSDR